MIFYHRLNAAGDPERITEAEYVSSCTSEGTLMEMRARVDRTEIGQVTVSTVLLPVTFATGDEVPKIFETMVFGLPEMDDYQFRTSSLVTAKRTHTETVAAVELILKETK